MKKILSIVLALFTATTILTGCQQNKNTDSAGKTPILLGIPGGDATTPGKIVDNFKAQYADKYEITEDVSSWGDFVQKIKLQFVSKNDVTPVFFTDSMQAMTFGAQGAVLDLKDWVENELDTELYTNALYSGMDTEGHLWGVPHALNSAAVIYNKEVFDEKGIAYPTDDWTWQEMLDLAQKLTFDRDGDGKVDVYGISYTSNITLGWLPFMAAVGVNPYKDNFRNSNLDDPKIKEAMEKYAQPIRDGFLMPAAELAAYGGTNPAFADGKIAMALVQATAPNQIAKFNPELDFDAVLMPIGWNGERSCIYVPNQWQIYSGVDKEVEIAAKDWLKHYLSEESQIILADEGTSFPIMKKALDHITTSGRIPEHIDAFYKGIDEHGMTLLENPVSASTRLVVDNMAFKIMAGEDVDEWIKTAHTDMQRELDYFYENQNE